MLDMQHPYFYFIKSDISEATVLNRRIVLVASRRSFLNEPPFATHTAAAPQTAPAAKPAITCFIFILCILPFKNIMRKSLRFILPF